MSKINCSTQYLQWTYKSGHVPSLFGSVSQTRQVLLIGTGNAFADGIANLLSHQPGLNIRYAIYRDDVSILKNVVQNQPDVVVLLVSRSMNVKTIVSMLMSVRTTPHLRILVLSLDTSQIQIYEKGILVEGIKSTNIFPVKVNDFLLLIDKRLPGDLSPGYSL